MNIDIIKQNIVDTVVEAGGSDSWVYIKKQSLVKASGGTAKEYERALEELVKYGVINISIRESKRGYNYFMYKLVEVVDSGTIDINNLPVGYEIEKVIAKNGAIRTYIKNEAGSVVSASCSVCKNMIGAENFYKDKNGKYGLMSRCKSCSAEYNKQQYHKRAKNHSQSILTTSNDNIPVDDLKLDMGLVFNEDEAFEVMGISEVVAEAVVEDMTEDRFEAIEESLGYLEDKVQEHEEKIGLFDKFMLKLKNIFKI